MECHPKVLIDAYVAGITQVVGVLLVEVTTSILALFLAKLPP